MSVLLNEQEFIADMKRAESGLLEAGKSVVRRAAVVAWQTAIDTSLYKDVTGRLRSRTRPVEGRNEYSAALIAGTRYASFVNNGTRPHTISAKSGGYLRFRVNGAWVQKRSVRHPGTSKRPFMAVAAKSGEQFLVSELQLEASSAVNQ